MHTDSRWSQQEACFSRATHIRCGSLSITTTVSLLANEFGVHSVSHAQVRLAAVNQMYVIHEAMNCCKNLKIHQTLALKMLILDIDLGLELQCLLKVKQDFSQVLIFQHAILNAK